MSHLSLNDMQGASKRIPAIESLIYIKDILLTLQPYWNVRAYFTIFNTSCDQSNRY
jgi:hypothetical protein